MKKMTLQNNGLNMATKRRSTISQSPTEKMTKKFCESTSLHGFSFMYNANTIVVKLIWIFSIIAMMGVGTFFLVTITDTYIKSRLSTNFESSIANLDVSILSSSEIFILENDNIPIIRLIDKSLYVYHIFRVSHV